MPIKSIYGLKLLEENAFIRSTKVLSNNNKKMPQPQSMPNTQFCGEEVSLMSLQLMVIEIEWCVYNFPEFI